MSTPDQIAVQYRQALTATPPEAFPSADPASPRLTVCQLVPTLVSGGVERGTLEVANELSRRGHRSLVISAGGKLVPQLIREGSEHFTWPIGKKSIWTLRCVERLKRFLAAEQVDILHARSRMPAWVAWLAWRKMNPLSRPRFVTSVHGFYSVNRYSAIMTKGEAVIAISDAVRQYILNNYPGTDPQRVHLIRIGIDEQAFPHGYQPSAAWLSRWHLDYPELGSRPLITLPGRLVRLKGHLAFLDLMTRFRDLGVAVDGLIVGGEDPRRRGYAAEVRKLIDERQLRNVTLTGERSDIREIYAISDIVMSLSTRPEGFGRTVAEALSIGTPVIGFDQGGVSEILSSHYPQGLVPCGDFEQLCQRILNILKQKPAVSLLPDFQQSESLNRSITLYEQLGAPQLAGWAA